MLLGCIATWTGYSLMGKRLMVGIDSLTATTMTALFGCGMLWLAALVVDGPGTAVTALTRLDTTGLIAMVFLALGAWRNDHQFTSGTAMNSVE